MEAFLFDLQRFANNTWRVGGTDYDFISKAINAADSGATITLTSGGSVESASINLTTKNVTINLNDKSLILGSSNFISVSSGYTLTLYNSKSGSISANTITNNGTIGLTNTNLGGTTSSNSNGTFNVTNGSFTDNANTNFAVRSGTVTFATSSGGVSTAKELKDGVTFTVTPYQNNAVTYNVKQANTHTGLLATKTTNNGKLTKYKTGIDPTQDYSMSEDLDFDKLENYAIVADDSSGINLTISSDDVAAYAKEFPSNPPKLDVIGSTNYSTKYGTLTPNADGTYKLEKEPSAAKFNSVTVKDGLTVEFTNDFQNVPITVSDTSGTTTTTKAVFVSAGNEAFIVNDNNGSVSINGATNVSLNSGTIATANSNQTVGAGTYSISGYADEKSNKNGITIAYDTLSATATVGDIDRGESFSLGSTKYFRDNLGLRTGTDEIYTGVTIDEGNDKFGVDVAKLITPNMSRFIQPADGGVLTIGGTNSFNALVLNDTSNLATSDNATIYGELTKVSDGNYKFATIYGGNADAFQDSLYADNVNVTIDSALGRNRTISTKGGAKFIVTSTGSATTFVVDGSNAAPKITDAEKITLLDGKITVANTQTITLGSSGKEFKISSSKDMTVTASNNAYSVTGANGDEFTIDGKVYKVTDGNGVTFTADTSGNVIVGGVSQGDGDVFSVGDSSYSVKGAGFFRTDSNKNISLWNESGKHFLTGGTVAGASLTSGSQWANAVTVANDSVTLSSANVNSAFVDSNYNTLYGLFTDAGSHYSLDRESTSNPQFKNVSLGAAGTFSIGANLTNVTIQSDAATLSVTDDDNDGYQLVTGGTALEISGAKGVSLTSGTIEINSQNISSSDGITYKFTATDTGTIGAIDQGDKFNIGSNSYIRHAVGLMDSNNKLFNSSKLTNNSAAVDDLKKADNWTNTVFIDNSTLTLPNTSSSSWIIIDDANSPSASLGTVSYTNSTYKIDRTDNSFSISAADSGALFTTSETSFTVQDSSNGATIGANSLTLAAGKIAPTSTTQTVTAISNAVNLGKDTGNVFTLNVSGNSATLGGLDTGDVFNVGGISYELLSSGRLKKGSGSLWSSVKLDTTNASITMKDLLDTSNWYSRADLTISSDKILTLDNGATSIIGGGGSAYIVDAATHAKIYGTLSYDTSTKIYTLDKPSEAVDSGEFEIVALTDDAKKVKFTSSISDKIITTAGSQSATFTAAGSDGFTVDYSNSQVTVKDATTVNLTLGTLTLTDTKQTLTANNNNVIVQSGSVTVNRTKGSDVVVGSIDAQGDSVKIGSRIYTLKSFTESGGISVSMKGTAPTVYSINAGDCFTIDDVEFTRGSGGFVKKVADAVTESHYWWTKSDQGTIVDVGKGVAVSYLMNLDADTWTEIWEAENGVLNITSETPAKELQVVNVDNVTTAVTYGKLSKTSGVYALTQSTGDTDPNSINITGVKATFPVSCAQLVTANNASFSVTPKNDTFTVDATDTYAKSEDVTDINLTQGTLQAVKGIPITAGGYTVGVTNGDITVSVTDNVVSVGALNVGDKFTVNGTEYERTAAGLFDAKNKQVIPDITDTYILGEAISDIIAVSGTTLDLTKQTKDARVYDSVTNPTTFLATFNVGSELTLTGESVAASKIKTIKIPANTALNVDFAATVNAPKGSVTVNGNIYDAQSSVVVQSDGSSSTLFSGTIKLDSGTSSATATNDKTSLIVNNGTLVAAAAKGKFTKLDNLDTGDSFTFNGNTYTQSAVGLVNDGKICESLKGSSIDVDKLPTANFVNMIASADGKLSLANQSTAIVVDDITAPTKKFGNLTVSGTSYTIDYTTQVQTPTGSFTVNGQAYTATTALTLDTTAKTSTIYEGTLTLNSSTPTATATNDKTALTATGGTITAIAAAGKFTTLNGLDAGENFTFGGKTYTQSALGLTNDGKICADLAGTTLDLSKLSSANFVSYLAPVNGVINLDDVKASAAVFDKADNPTTQLGNLTKSGSTFTLDFAIKATTSGNVTVNGQAYDAQGDITLDTTATTSTLATGTVALASGKSVNTSSGNSITVKDGDITVTAGNDVTIGDLTAGDVFTVDGTEYALTNAALCKGDLIYTDDFSGSITVAQLNSDAWGAVLKINGDTLDINADTAAGIVVSTDINKLYGKLEKISDGFSLTKGNDDLAAINVDGTKIELAADFASVPLTAGDSTFGNITLNRNQKFTLDDTGTAPTLGNVKSFTLNAGNVLLTENQTVTAGENIIGAVKGSMLVDDGTISALEQDDAFTLNGTNYKLTAGGLLNTDNNSLVTSGLDGSTLTIADMQETQLIAPVNGVIDLDNVTGNARVVDNVTNPTTTLGNITADGSTYTVDFATKAKASGNVTVNGQSYDAQGDITLDTTATTSTLTSGTVKLDGGIVTTTSGNVISGNSITVTAGDEISIGDLTAGDAFTVDGAAYTVNTLAPMNSNGELWTGKDFSSGLTITELADAANWSELFAIADASINITPTTLNDGEDVLLVDDASNPTKIFGTLAKAEDKYTLDTDGESFDALTISKTVVSVDSALAKVPITTVNADNSESAFTVTPERGAEFFTVDATGNSPTIDGVTEIEVIKGGVVPGEGQTVIPAEDSEGDIKLLFGNGTHTVGDKTFTIDGLKEGNDVSVELNAAGNVKKFSGFDKDSTLTIDGTTYTAPKDNATLTYTDDDGWYFENYSPESYTVTVDRQGNVSVDVGVKFSDVVSSGKTSNGAITLAADVAETPVTIINQYGELKVDDANGSLVDVLSKTSATIARDNDEIIFMLDEGDLTLSAGNYTVNDKKFTAQGAAQVAIANDLTFDLSKGDAITYNAHEFSGSGKLTIGDGLTVDGNVTIAGKTINASEATAIVPTANGLTVGETTLTVTGDDTYTINISGGTIVGLEEIGGNVTVGGLSNATVKTNAAGSLTVDKTFTSSSETTYTITDGKLVAAQTELISGDFSDGLTVNETTIHATGGNVSVMSAGLISGADSGVLILAAGGISAEGSFAIGSDVSNFKAGDDNLTLTGNGTATIDIANGKVNAAHGISGTIAGLDDATVYGATNANVNGKALDVSGTDCAAIVFDGEAVGLVGVDAGATVASAPTMTVKTIANGTFTFTSDSYNINDTVDGSVDFVTDAQSKVTDIQNFAGELSGAIGDVNLNGKEFSTNDQNVTVTTDGENITAINGLKSGDSIGGDLDNAGFTLPEGSVSVNGTAYTLAGDDEVSVSDGGSVIGGLAKDASLTVSEAGTYKINGRILTAQAGDTFSVNREGVYKTDPTNPPVTEQTPSSEITARGMELVESGSGSVKADDDGVVIRHGSQATVDVSDGGLIVPLSDAVTLENYNDAAKVQTFDYNNVGNAIKNNEIKFGDGEMTLGDAVITFNDNASPNGSTRANLLNASGNALQVGFTHTAGGTLDMSDADGSVLMKGNYAEKSSDTQKSGGSTLIGGDGNDTLLIGGGDVADAGAGTNQIYITDSRLREAGTTIAFTDGRTTIHNFTPGFTDKSDVIRVSDLSAVDFDFNGSTLTMTSGNAQMIFSTSAISADLVESADLIANDDSFKLKVSDGNRTYNTAVAKDGGNITVSDGDAANLFYGDASGINFSEFSGAVEVNLGNASGHVGGSAAKFYGIDKVAAGKGNTTLNGAAGANNTLIAGIGNTSIWSAKGADLMTGNTSADKTGSTTFYYLADDGRDSITSFDFATSATDKGDLILTTPANEITAVSMSGSAVLMQINHSANDYLTLTEAAGKNFRVDRHMAKVDKNVSYDAITTCYVADASNATMTVGENMGDAVVWLCDKNAVLGKYYLGDIKVLDAMTANGRNSLVGNDNDNYIYGGTGENSLWGGWNSNDVMQGGSGRNMFFLTLQNGHDTIQNAHDGDVVKLSLYLEHIASADITAGGTRIEVTDGTTLEVKSNAAIEYRLADGSTYIADHNSRQWNQK